MIANLLIAVYFLADIYAAFVNPDFGSAFFALGLLILAVVLGFDETQKER